jgi:hypothetical protein
MTIYLTNQNPTSANGGLTLIYLYTSQPPKLNHLKVFGCLAYIYVVKLIGGKMEPRSTKSYLWDMITCPRHIVCITLRHAQIVISKGCSV